MRPTPFNNVAIDARYAWRSLRHSPSFAAVVVLLLTAGIGLTTAVFSLVNGILLEPLPYPNAGRLVRVSETSPYGLSRGGATGRMSDVSLGAWLTVPTVLAAITPYAHFEIVVGLPGSADSLVVADVGGQFFAVFGVRPVAGRALLPSDNEPQAQPAAVISERLARRSFGDPQTALGQSIGLETQTHVIVGVLPPGFAFPTKEADVWRPGRQYRRLPQPGERRNVGMSTSVAGLLREGATLADANASGVRVSQALALASAEAMEESAPERTFSTTRLLDDMVAPMRPALLVLSGGMAVVLLAISVTLTNLLLGRNTARQRELAVRLALGASRWRLARPVALELLMLAAAGAAGGMLLGWWLLGALPAISPADVPRIETIRFDLRAAAVALAAAIFTIVSVGWLPLLQIRSVGVSELTASGARVRVGRLRASADRLRGALVIGQVATAVALLVAALLIGRSLATLLQVDLGYRPEGVLTFKAAHTFAASREPGRLKTYYTELLARLRSHPSISSAGFAAVLPLHPISIRSSVSVVGRPPEPRQSIENMAVNQPVSIHYLPTIGTRVVRGRGFNDDDRGSSEKVVLVDEVLAGRYFPSGDAIGQQLFYARSNWTIVGVVQAMRIGALGESPPPIVYFPADQLPEFLGFSRAGVAVRTSGDPRALEGVVRQIAREIDPRVQLHSVQPLSDLISGNVAQPRFFTIVLGLFSVLALATAFLGIYGVLAYAVERRRFELGIRRALGATERHVFSMVVGHGVLLAVAGIALGLAAAAAGSRFMRALLFGVSTADPLSYGGAAVLALGIALLASWEPLRRALRVDPAQALRVD